MGIRARGQGGGGYPQQAQGAYGGGMGPGAGYGQPMQPMQGGGYPPAGMAMQGGMQGGMQRGMQGMQPGMGNYNQQAYPNQQMGMPQMMQQPGMGNGNYARQPQQQQQDSNPFF